MSYKDYLGRSFGGQYITPTEAIDGTRQCPIGQMTLCVTSGNKFNNSKFIESHCRAKLT